VEVNFVPVAQKSHEPACPQTRSPSTPAKKIKSDFLLSMQNVLKEATGIKWVVDVVRGHLGETLADKEAVKDREEKKDVMDLPLVKAIMAEFKGAKIESLTRKIMEQAEKSEEFEIDDLIYMEEEN
jgi:hypothetical protein